MPPRKNGIGIRVGARGIAGGIAGGIAKTPLILVAVFFAYSFLLMLLCTKSSPVFPYNDYPDANIYFTMGKGMMSGHVPYVDLIDNKGPLLYLIYGLAWLLQPSGFSGVYIAQSLLLGLSVLYTYKLARLFVTSSLYAALAALLSPMLMLSSRLYASSYDGGGGSPEEFCRALMIVALYYFVLFFTTKEKSIGKQPAGAKASGSQPTGTSSTGTSSTGAGSSASQPSAVQSSNNHPPKIFRLRHTMLLGALMSCVFMMKFTYTVFWLGFLLGVCFCFRFQLAELCKHIGIFIAGFVLCAAPFVIYALATGSLGAFFEEYFIFNLSYVGFTSFPLLENPFPLARFFMGIWSFIVFIIATLVPSLSFLSGFVFVFRRTGKYLKWGYLLSFALMFIVSYFTRVFPFTSIPVTVFCLFGLVWAAHFAERAIPPPKLAYAIVAVCLIFFFTASDNNLSEYFVLEEIDGIVNYQEGISEFIKNDGIQNPRIVELMTLDSAIYTVCGVIPNTPYFYKPNIDHAIYPEVLEAQHALIANRQVDYAIVELVGGALVSAYSDEEMRYMEGILATLREEYELVAQFNATGYRAYCDFHLYRLKSEPHGTTTGTTTGDL